MKGIAAKDFVSRAFFFLLAREDGGEVNLLAGRTVISFGF